MAACVQWMDEMLKDYLLFRGFTSTLKALENDIKTDKEKGFRPDKIVDQLVSFIHNYDLHSLRDFWNHIDARIFSRLEQSQSSAVHKLEISLFKLYVVNTVQNGRTDKVNEFFEKMSPELHAHQEWKDWFAMPFLKSAEDMPAFQMYFTKQWQESFLLSLHNFLAIIFQSMPVPAILSYYSEEARLNKLEEENAKLRQCLASTGKVEPADNSCVTPPADIIDDFSAIAQEQNQPIVDVSSKEQKGIKSFMKNIGGSPKPARKPETRSEEVVLTKRHSQSMMENNGTRSTSRPVSAPESVIGASSTTSVTTATPAKTGLSSRAPSSAVSQWGGVSNNKPGATSVTTPPPTNPAQRITPSTTTATPGAPRKRSSASSAGSGEGYLVLGQERYAEHSNSVVSAKFSHSGDLVASLDSGGILKVWTLDPPRHSPTTLCSVIAKHSITNFEWASKRSDRLIILATKSGCLRVFDSQEKKNLMEAPVDMAFPNVISLASSPGGSEFVCASGCDRHHMLHTVAGSGDVGKSQSQLYHPGEAILGKLSQWDLKSMRVMRSLPVEPFSVAVNCTCYNHNGQLLLAGCADGRIRLFDMQRVECIASWQAHDGGGVFSVQFSPDENSCYSIGADAQFVCWSVHKTGQRLYDLPSATPTLSSSALSHAGGKLFAFDADGKHVVTCAKTGATIYTLPKSGRSQDVREVATLGGANDSVVSVDWSSALDSSYCLSASKDSTVYISTLLNQK